MRRAPVVRRRLAAAALAACLLPALSGCGVLDGAEGTGDKGFVSGDGRITQVPVADRGEPVELSGSDLDGAALDLADLRGAPVVVNVWGSWCAPCRTEAPLLVDAAEELEGDAAFVGINIRDASPAQGQRFERTFEVPYPSVFSPNGDALLAFAGSLTPNAVPSTVVLDAEGRVAATILGEVPSALTLVDLVEEVAAGG